MYFHGYWEITNVEEISRKKYNIRQRDHYGEWVGTTDETVIITKTTFRNGRTRYNTIKLES